MGKAYIKILNRFETIYFFSCDPGSFYAAEPIYDDMKALGKKCIWIFDGWCAIDKKNIIDFEYAKDFRKNARTRNDTSSCIIIGTQVCYQRNFSMMEHCKARGLFTIFLFDCWTNYLNCFMDLNNNKLYFTDMIFIMDGISKEALIKEIIPYVSEHSYLDNIIITGHQGIEKTVTMIGKMSDRKISEFKNRLNPDGKRLVLLILEPIEKDFGYLKDGTPFLGFNESTTIRYIFNNLDSSKIKLLIKPHPRHEKGFVEKLISVNLQEGNFDFEITYDSNLNLLIASSDEVLGMTSTVLVIALKCGKQIKSFQINRNKNGKKTSNLYLEPYVILK